VSYSFTIPQDAEQETRRIATNFLKRFKQCLAKMELSLDWRSLAAALEADPHQLAGDNVSIDFQQYFRLLELAAPQLRDTGFYLQLGHSYDITDVGVLGYALLSVENLRKSWELTFHSSSFLLHPLTNRRSLRDGRVEVELQAPAYSLADSYLMEEWLAGTWKWICQRLPLVADSPEMTLELSYAEPTYGSDYHAMFPGAVKFSQPVTRLSFPEAWYDLPFPAANPAAALLCQQQCQLITSQLEKGADLVEQVRRSLLLNPQRGFPSQEEMAARFRLPGYTFHRRLVKAGKRYNQIVGEVRMELAKHYLQNSQLPLQEISYLLAYEHPPSFYRAFKKWFGITPETCRQPTEFPVGH